MNRRQFLRLLPGGMAMLAGCGTYRTPTGGTLPPVGTQGEQLIAAGWRFEARGVNYTHPAGADLATCGMLQFGADAACPWDLAPMQRDFARLRELGVDTIRVFLNYYVFGGQREFQPAYDPEPAFGHFADFLRAANQQGIYVVPVLMAKYPQDTFAPAYYERTIELHVRPVVERFANTPGILMWDLFNEPDIGSPVTIRCWDWDNELEPRCFPLAEERMHFLQAIHTEVKRLDPQRLTTVSMAFAKSYFEPHNAFMRMADLVDVLTFHYYDDSPANSGRYAQHWYYGQGFPSDLQRSIRELRALQTNKPILVTEIGFPTGPQDTRDTAAMRRDLATALRVIREEGSMGMFLWPFQTTPDTLVGDTFR
jgi:hypothetical protein